MHALVCVWGCGLTTFQARCDVVSKAPSLSVQEQGHQFKRVRGFMAKSPVDLHKVCVLQLSTDGLQLVVRLVNKQGTLFLPGDLPVNPSM